MYDFNQHYRPAALINYLVGWLPAPVLGLVLQLRLGWSMDVTHTDASTSRTDLRITRNRSTRGDYFPPTVSYNAGHDGAQWYYVQKTMNMNAMRTCNVHSVKAHTHSGWAGLPLGRKFMNN